MTITVTQQQAQFQAGTGGTVLHSITSSSIAWATGEQVLFPVAFHHNALADRDLASMTASAGTLASGALGNATNYTGASYKLDGSVAFAEWSAGATATLTATDNTADGADMWLTGCVLKLAGASTSSPIRQSKVAGVAAGGATSVSVTMDTPVQSNNLLVAICVANANNAWSLPSGWDAITGLAESGWGGYHATTWKSGGISDTTSFPCAANGGGLAVVVYEIVDAAGSTPTPFPFAANLNRRSV